MFAFTSLLGGDGTTWFRLNENVDLFFGDKAQIYKHVLLMISACFAMFSDNTQHENTV